MIVFLIWVLSVIICAVIAKEKKYGMGSFIALAIFFGPLALIIALLVPVNKTPQAVSGIHSLGDAKNELETLKRVMNRLQGRIGELEAGIARLSGFSSEAGNAQPPAPVQDEPQSVVQEKKQERFELVFGQYWLSRIGIIVFVLGIAFFISYTFQYLTASAKIATGFLLSACLLYFGNKLEQKEKYVKIGWAVLGGGWGLLYLSAYAMHYIDATKIITSSVVGIWILAVASAIVVIYNLKYRSWVVSSVSYLLAFITAGLGAMEYSTILYWTFLTASVAYLAYRFQWHKFLLLGICGSYLTYIFWIHPQMLLDFMVPSKASVPLYQFHLGISILAVSWIIFSAVLFFFDLKEKERSKYILGANLLNGVFFAFLGLNEIYRALPHLVLSWDARFWFIFTLALVYFGFAYYSRHLGKSRGVVLNAGLALSFVAMSILIKIPSLNIGFFWLLEMLIIFALGFYYKEMVYRILGSILGFLVFIRLFCVDYFSYKTYALFGFDIKHRILIFSFAALCFFILGAFVRRKAIAQSLARIEKDFYNAFAVIGTVLLIFLLEKEVARKWLTLSWTLEGISILTAGFLLRNRIYRFCALSAISLACVRLVLIDMAGLNAIYKILTFILFGVVLVAVSLVYSKLVSKLENESE
ncbi:MAG: DUF2339 domain-containing protein [Candidatus Omnitrophota bacterium]